MGNRQSPVRVVVLSQDPALSNRIEQEGPRGNFTLVKDLPSLQNAIASRSFDGVIIESNGCRFDEFIALNGSIDLSRKFLLAGPLPAFEVLNQFIPLSVKERAKGSKPEQSDPNLADYVEEKFKGFVKAMKLGSARNLYPTLMRAVERPLIELALRETNGNQLQASQLLGMNRNTLRKKINEFKISVGRYKTERSV